MTRRLPFFFAILFIAICFEALKVDYYSRSLIAALLLAIGFVVFVFYDAIFKKIPIGNFHILLGIPVVTLLALVTMGDMMGLSQVAIWVIFVGVTVLCVGFASRRAW